eukprot:TRINITY_DN33002_c0_g1_i1.p1 TRINITY_DN33002_c0_g1~~TRINITY_DN33002_c0_g1_i1.p1  ORF type:complete len:1080 (+),score=244.90 TRINITY_DN33002_c0_g1_i1:116-3355(+)
MERVTILRSLTMSLSAKACNGSARRFNLACRHRYTHFHSGRLKRRREGFPIKPSRLSQPLYILCQLGSQTMSHRTVSSASASASAFAAPQASAAEASLDVVKKLGFEKIDQHFIREYNSTATLYKHKKTGAEVMSVCNQDENKVFGIVFRTPPKDSTGIPHILEHSVLCGSRKYPLKEPFVELLKGSLNTFLNAFTYPDRTCYPVASTNLKDFYNLVDVYLDAVFFPKCVNDIQTFQQEGWHYELNDPTEEISLKGVVFNEMKGVYSQPENILGRISQQALFPDNTYGVDSGGDPKMIPRLTFEEFKDFHRRFYHPSNARIWFYGDDDPNERLKIISEYLEQFDDSKSAKDSEIRAQRLFPEPKRILEKYPVGDAVDINKRHMVCLNWLLSEKPLDLDTELALGFLDHLLLGTPAAPLRKTLLESGLGDAIVGGGIEGDLLQPQFSIGLKNVSKEDVTNVEELIMSTLRKLANEGFTSDAVEASINTIEFALRENNTGSFPRGLSLMLRSLGKWVYDNDPFEPLKFEKPLEDLKGRIEREGSKTVFCSLIQRFILDNPHRVTIELQPDPDKASEEEAVEQENLRKLKSSLSEKELTELARATTELRLKQETPDPPEALRTVPCLSLEDIPKKPVHVPSDIGEINGVKVLRHDIFTNDILYAQVVFDMRPLKPSLLPLVPLFCQSLLEMGTKDMSFVELSQLMGRKTGGISIYPSISSVRGKQEPSSHIIVNGKAMAGRASDLFNLIQTLLQHVQLTDQKRFKQFVSQYKARMESCLTGSGHRICACRMDAKLNTAGWGSEQMGGLSYLEFLQNLENRVEVDWPAVSSSLEEIRNSLFSRNGSLINLTADEKNIHNAEKYITELLDALPETSSSEVASWDHRVPQGNEAVIVPTQVNYVGKAANIYEAGYELSGSAYVISKHIGNSWLWDRVRVSGGAYGGFCDFDSHSGVFSYLSYRDPNLLKTIDIYDETCKFLRDLDLDADSLRKAIIGTIGDVDAYQLPDAKGYSSLMRYLVGVTEEERERRREEILSTSLKDFRQFSEFLESVKEKGVVVAIASAEDVARANQERPGFLLEKKVL